MEAELTTGRIIGAAVAGAVLGVGLAPAAMAQEKVVTIARTLDADKYDPHVSTARSAAEVLFMTGDTLVVLDYDMKTIRPNLAKSWTISDDGLTYTFKLRDDVKFCSGKKFTAADVKGSLDRWQNMPKGTTKWRAGEYDSTTVVDDYTLEYKIKKPYSELLYQMTQHNHTVINPEEAEKLGDDLGVKALDGTGPYCFAEWQPRNQLTLTKNPYYDWAPSFYDNKKPMVDKVVWKIVPEDSTRVAALETGQSDALQYVPWWAVPQFQSNPRFSVSKAEAYFWTYYVGMKISRDLMSDLRVREAINLGVDQAAIAEAVWFGLAEPANAYISPGVLDYATGQDTSMFGYDPKKAEALLDEAGWKKGSDGFRYKDGVKFAPLAYGNSSPVAADVLQSVQGDLRKIGVDMQIQQWDATVVWGKLKTQDFDMFTMSYPYVSAGDALNLYFRSANMPAPNRMNWNDPETDQWLTAASAALTDKERAENFAKVQKKVHAAAVWIPIVHEPLFLVSGPKLKPIKAHGNYGAGFYKGLGIELKG